MDEFNPNFSHQQTSMILSPPLDGWVCLVLHDTTTIGSCMKNNCAKTVFKESIDDSVCL